MKNKEIIEELNILNNLIEKEHYNEAQNEIKKFKNKIKPSNSDAAEYIDELVEELK